MYERKIIKSKPAIDFCMRKVSLFIASSLDNYIARENGGIDWLFSHGNYGYKEFYDSIDTVLMGRKTYETALKLGEHFSGKDCYVFSRSENGSNEENIHFESDPVRLTKRLIVEQGRGIFLEGGGEMISVFLNENLIDEIILSIHPTILGSGIPLFGSVKKQVGLKLLRSARFENGLVQVRYEVLKNLKRIEKQK